MTITVPSIASSDFLRAFAGRVRETLAAHRTDALLDRVAGCVRENGATPEQREALTEVCRVAAESGSTTAAQSLLNTIDVDRRTWKRQIISGGQSTEVCPAWCTADHGIDACSMLDDLTHLGSSAEMFVNTFDHWSNGEPVSLPTPILRADIRVDPYSENPKRNVPFAGFEPFQDEVMDELGPDELAAVVAQIREHCDRLDQVVANLRTARADWAQNGGVK